MGCSRDHWSGSADGADGPANLHAFPPECWKNCDQLIEEYLEMANKAKGGQKQKKAPAKDSKAQRQEKKMAKAKNKLRTGGSG